MSGACLWRFRTHKERKRMISDRLIALVVCGCLLLAVIIVFEQTATHDFVNFDDPGYVSKNPQISQGLTLNGLRWVFTHSHVGNWHPLSGLSHMLDCQLYGLRPAGHHVTNVVLHAATAILLFLVLRQMSGEIWPSALAAAVFAVHPLRAESVAWIAERKDVLSGLFFMLTLGAYVAYTRRPFSFRRYLVVVGLFALGLMAKPMLITLPCVLLLLDYWPLGRLQFPGGTNESAGRGPGSHPTAARRVLLEKVPLMALAAGSAVATILAQAEAVRSVETFPLSARIANAIVSYVAYLGQFVCPVGLSVLYPHPGNGIPAAKVAGALLLLAAASTGIVLARRRCPYLLVGWLWYLGMLVPVIGLVQVGEQAMADRYTYLPQIGLCIGLAWGVARFSESRRRVRWISGVAAVLVLAALMGAARRQVLVLARQRDALDPRARLPAGIRNGSSPSERLVGSPRAAGRGGGTLIARPWTWTRTIR